MSDLTLVCVLRDTTACASHCSRLSVSGAVECRRKKLPLFCLCGHGPWHDLSGSETGVGVALLLPLLLLSLLLLLLLLLLLPL